MRRSLPKIKPRIVLTFKEPRAGYWNFLCQEHYLETLPCSLYGGGCMGIKSGMFLSDALKQGQLGDFSKFMYRCNGLPGFVYCISANDFTKLVASWNDQSIRNCNGRFSYTFSSVEGVPMSLDQIASDLFVKDFSTAGSRVLKMVLQDSYTGVWYIQ